MNHAARVHGNICIDGGAGREVDWRDEGKTGKHKTQDKTRVRPVIDIKEQRL